MSYTPLTTDERRDLAKKEIGYDRHVEHFGVDSANTILYHYMIGFKKAEELIMSNNNSDEFQPNDISNVFKNVSHKPSKVPCYDLAFKITDSGRFFGELFYSKELREWFFIKDNYPSPRKAYRFSFPINSKTLFIEIFKTVGITLIKDDE